MVHGRIGEATRIVDEIEARITASTGRPLPPAQGTLRLIARGHTSLREVARTLIRRYPRRTVLGIVLIASQAFFYNAIFFTYALVLRQFYGIGAASIGWYLLPFALGNFTGPLLLGRWFDTIGRRPMIAATYALSGVLLAGVAAMFGAGLLDATTQTVAWSMIFFFASAAASAAYLTISESFPLEVRAIAIALFYAGGTLLGGVAAPWLFGRLIASGERRQVVWGYLLGAVLMVGAAIAELVLGIAAERRPLESIAAPLSSAD
jgi:MFS family permease